jgi:HSP20 family protein
MFDSPESFLSGERPIQVEEYVDDGHLVVKADMPGIDPERDVEVSVQDGMLRLRAERRQESEVEDKRGYHSEVRYGMYSRTLPLPAGASEEDVEATYHDGVLEVRLPVGEPPTQARKIPVKRS